MRPLSVSPNARSTRVPQSSRQSAVAACTQPYYRRGDERYVGADPCVRPALSLLFVDRGEIDRGRLDVERLQLRAFRHAEWEGAGKFGNRSWIDEVRRREVFLVRGVERGRPLSLQRRWRITGPDFERDRHDREL